MGPPKVGVVITVVTQAVPGDGPQQSPNGSNEPRIPDQYGSRDGVHSYSDSDVLMQHLFNPLAQERVSYRRPAVPARLDSRIGISDVNVLIIPYPARISRTRKIVNLAEKR